TDRPSVLEYPPADPRPTGRRPRPGSRTPNWEVPPHVHAHTAARRNVAQPDPSTTRRARGPDAPHARPAGQPPGGGPGPGRGSHRGPAEAARRVGPRPHPRRVPGQVVADAGGGRGTAR